MEKAKSDTKRFASFQKVLFVVFILNIVLPAIEIIYCLTVGVPLSALTFAPFALLIAVGAFLAWRSNCTLWTIPGIACGSYIWFFTLLRWPILIPTLALIIALITDVVLYFRRTKEERKAHRKDVRKKLKMSIITGCAALLAFSAVFISGFTIGFDGMSGRTVISAYKEPHVQAGEVVRLEYDSFVYDSDGNAGEAMPKYCNIYLPYNYDDTKEYNILYLMHGGGADAGSWLDSEQGMTTKNMLDTMIAEKQIEPLIVVTPSFYRYNDSLRSGAYTMDLTTIFKYELRNDLIPAVESKYSTYAGKDTSAESLIASRDYRGFGGYSMGSATTYQSAMIGSLDYFSYFAPMHGGFIDHDEVLDALTKGEFKDYEINYLLCCDGTLDRTYLEHVQLYEKLIASGEIKEGVNADFLTLMYRMHDISAWQSDLYNALLMFYE